MATTQQNKEFKNQLVSDIEDNISRDYLEESIIPWINTNLEPDDVFDKKDLENWAESNGYVKE